MEIREESKQKLHGAIITSIILGVAIIAAIGGYFLNDCLRDNSISEAAEKEKEEEEAFKASISQTFLDNTVGMFDQHIGGDSVSMGYFYAQDKILSKDFSDDAILIIAMKNVVMPKAEEDSNGCPKPIEVLASDVLASAKKIFGDDVKYDNKDFVNYFTSYKYDSVKKKYTITTPCGIGSVGPRPYIYTKNVKTVITKTKVEIYNKVAYLAVPEELGNDETYDVYNSMNKATGTYLGKAYGQYIDTEMIEKVNTYKTTFNIDSKDNRLIFSSVELVK